jgi:hypothetical protein
LLGGSFSICIRNTVHIPLLQADLRTEIRENAQHTRAVTRLAEILGTEFATIDGLRTIRALSIHAKAQTLTETQRTEVKQNAKLLAWTNAYWSCSPTNTPRFLRLLQTNDDIPLDVPMNPDYIFETERVGLVMSAFGYRAPSFLVPSARRTATTVTEVPHNFIVRPVSTSAAIADMENVIERCYVTVHVLHVSKAHNDYKLTGENKAATWNIIRALTAPPVPANVDDVPGRNVRGGGVRARRNDNAFNDVF